MATNNGRNPFLLDGDEGFHVETEVGENGYCCKYTISETFTCKENDSPFTNGRGGKIRKFTIKVVVDLRALNSNPRPNYLFFEAPDLDNLRGRSNDPRDFLSGYPFDQLRSWVNSEGEKLIEWARRLEYSRYLRPSHQDCNGGKSIAQTDRERFAREIKEARLSLKFS